MLYIRFRYAEAGGHTHVRVFAGDVPLGETVESTTLGKCGDLTFRNEEWRQFMTMTTFKLSNIAFIPDNT